ncbi:Thymidilate synthase [Synechococcus phage S-CRM01]|uniref:thymidylate synthase n=1 Tax=Synechococcus phage S-CRM01 TaxID=1026955 RepID=UPI000209E38C|nr:thymidylate synthase [Synechococcus phage S-CRM01]AEC53026.1 Thymidilate synthase [Synechococcus phage S-CRM01]
MMSDNDSPVKLIATTSGAGVLQGKSPQEVITYVARVSNPSNQDKFNTAAGLLRYCIKEKHWSIFETASMTVEINTTRDISHQIIRHSSFRFQEFSQRYADTRTLNSDIQVPELRRQDTKNRQNSIDDLPPGLVEDYQKKIQKHYDDAMFLYNNLLDSGVAKECARKVLPEQCNTRLYMTGSCRSWIHYIGLRSGNGTQKEHQLIAQGCYDVFKHVFPDVAEALNETSN